MQKKLSHLGQQHLLAYWAELSLEEKKDLLHQVQHLDENLIYQLQRHLKEPLQAQMSLEPFLEYSLRGSEENQKRGKEAIAAGKCACLTVAGGQGSRLRFSGPKGCFPISPIKKKSLFQLVAEKIKAAGKQVKRPLHWAIMTSPLNHIETETFFDSQGFFGLSASQVHFFYQDLWPLMDLEANLFLDAPGHIAEGPNGNGSTLRRLVESGIFRRLQEEGVEMISFTPIDNPLADPFDAELFGSHEQQQNEVTIKAIFRSDSQEKVGILVKSEGKVHVIEYSEFPQEYKEKKIQGEFRFPLANLSLFCFSLPFVQKAAALPLPFHRALKAVKKWDVKIASFPQEPNAWKFEEFIFDVLPIAEKVSALIYSREECFAPLKNYNGPDSIEAVQAALQAADRKAIFRVLGLNLPSDRPIEIAQDFYYPTDALIQKWKGREPLSAYIEGV